MQSRLRYLFATLLLLATEIGIALFVHDTVIRPFVGDVLVVVLIYCFLRIFVRVPAWAVLALACVIEVLQYFDFVAVLGLEHNRVLSVMLGRTFSWSDFLAYFVGFLVIVGAERLRSRGEAGSGQL